MSHEDRISKVIFELERYSPYSGFIRDSVQIAYDIFLDYAKDQTKNTIVNENQVIETISCLAEWGFSLEYIISALLYYPYLYFKERSEESKIDIGNEKVKDILNSLEKISILIDSIPIHKSEITNTNDKKIQKRQKKWDEDNALKSMNAFLAIAGSPEKAILKIVDRYSFLKYCRNTNLSLHNQQFPLTISQIAQQSLDIYAPVAEALGIWIIKWQLEDKAFKITNPDEYQKISEALIQTREQRENELDAAREIIEATLSRFNIQARVKSRVKHIYSIYQKIEKRGFEFDAINDLNAIRIIIKDLPEESASSAQCYTVRDILFSVLKPMEGFYEEDKLFRDWVANPKPNGYQSIHTTVNFKEKPLEVQIRTERMHQVAEYGAAAHWIYKKAGKSTISDRYSLYVNQMAELRKRFESLSSNS
ncbi:MAG: bifunctional (p)ppGpp synthetase/guanosine-3',5'-bis(diphosphate) 3'-pyrophosphohydrolase [Gammaproteobacteria bacterium]|nr:bifunctional (p)ppGpp synthetase/guanosine-3',5'-bis(diphosphate) 3'-pyrophosphohydrolase [Gammaproteobacteria bacterium]